MHSITAFHIMAQEAPLLLSGIAILFILGVIWKRSCMYAAVICFMALVFLFRNPDRSAVVSHDPYMIISPADGKIINIEYDSECALEGYCYKISIVVSPLDVHFNRIPSSGVVESVQHIPGQCNGNYMREHTDVVIRAAHGVYMMRQQAGIIARRVICWVNAGDVCKVGQLYGMILFWSRFELYLPKRVGLCVGIGQHVKAGITKLGEWRR